MKSPDACKPFHRAQGFTGGMPKLDVIMFVGCLAAIVGVVAYTRYGRARLQRCLASGICIHCGYNLTGNVSGRCPECGTDATWAAQELLAGLRQRRLSRASLVAWIAFLGILRSSIGLLFRPAVDFAPPRTLVAITKSAIGHNGPFARRTGPFQVGHRPVANPRKKD